MSGITHMSGLSNNFPPLFPAVDLHPVKLLYTKEIEHF
jgi:hypothetical protein